ncbi:magnesium transporter [Desulfosalsimonas propionicica]|uniref:Magnesium transporter MgtE n=1 Tax=Desulfosalsimonas propionicica TaxID=332175 RepID=A0A7W0CAJ0_9BACT|nr:magnesium transporter [Desulfosalsimonas propionicica]MBA2882195.1 magnesium transporter [Desulfosalsimonas propionicica]
MEQESSLLPLVEKFFEHDTAAAARSLARMTEEEAVEVLGALPAPLAVRAVRHLQVGYTAALLKDAEPAIFREIASSLDPQLAATIFMHLPNEARERLLEHIPGKLKKQIQELLTYPEDSVGRLMTTDFLSFHKEVTAREAVEKIRSLARKRLPASYGYVVDEEERLVGVMNMRDLMLASPEQPLESMMRTNVFSIHAFVDREQAGNELSKRRYFAAPIVDSENHMLGIIKAEQLIHGIQDEATEDFQRMFGAGADERPFSPILFSLKKRLPWLHVNLATAFLAAAVVAMFEGLIARLTILAVFLPVVAGQGGNAGAQSLAVVMRGLVMREIPGNKVSKLILKEGALCAASGVVIGLVTAMVAWVWNGNPFLGLVIGLGMFFNLVLAGLSGAAIPVLMKKLGLDPAQCSSIILTTVTDVMGFLIFLGLAAAFQAQLI